MEFVQTVNTENVPVILLSEMLLPIAAPTPQPGTGMAIALDAINVRSGPGTNYPSYGIVPKDVQVEVIGVSQDGWWWVVRVLRTDLVPDGQGWISADWVWVKNVEGVPVITPVL